MNNEIEKQTTTPEAESNAETAVEITAESKIYKNSAAFKMLAEQKAEQRIPSALFTDIDNTFIRKGHEAATDKLRTLATEQHIPIMAVTGNDFTGVMNRIQSGELPAFELIAGSVGTEIWVKQQSATGAVRYELDRAYEKKLLDTGFERTAIVTESQKIIDTAKTEQPQWQLNFQIPEREAELLQVPDPDYQRFKVSFHFFAESSELQTVAETFQQAFPSLSIVICEEIGHNSTLPEDAKIKKYCLDILPITKGGAVQHVAKNLEIENGIVAGDSGNDLSMLLHTGEFYGVLVGGYKPEARAGVAAHAIEQSGSRSFTKILNQQGEVESIYIENTSRKAAESIMRAATVLQRAERIKKIREKIKAS